jgi:hypothetical protein
MSIVIIGESCVEFTGPLEEFKLRSLLLKVGDNPGSVTRELSRLLDREISKLRYQSVCDILQMSKRVFQTSWTGFGLYNAW